MLKEINVVYFFVCFPGERVEIRKEVNSIQTSKKEHFRKDNHQIHFMNSCRFQGSIFTCAVDSFLEISFVLLCSLLKSTQLKSYFFELLRECFLLLWILVRSNLQIDWFTPYCQKLIG